MTKFTDQEIIYHYQQRKQELTKELSKIDAVLSALGDNGSSTKTPTKRKYTRRTTVTNRPAKSKASTADTIELPERKTATGKKTAKAETTTAKNPRSAKAAKKAPSTSSLTEPNQKGSWDQKIRHALGDLKSGTKENITQFITEKDPTTSAEKVRKALTLRLAILEKEGKLKKEPTGDQPQYRLG